MLTVEAELRAFLINKDGTDADVISVSTDWGSAGVQNDDPRLSPPSGHSPRRPAAAISKYINTRIFILMETI